MNLRSIYRLAAACLLLGLGACGGGGSGDDDGGTPPPPPPGIGAAGGTVTGPDGAVVEIPAGALSASTPIAIEQTSSGSPVLPGGLTTAGAMFAFTPHGTTFAVPVTITVPFDPAAIPAGATPRLFKTNSSNQWEPVANAVFGASTVTAEITGFSFVQPAFGVSLVGRQFSFLELRNTENLWEEVLLDEGTSLGGRLSEFRDLGPTSFDAEFALIDGRTFLPDGFASAAIESEETARRSTCVPRRRAPTPDTGRARRRPSEPRAAAELHRATPRTRR